MHELCGVGYLEVASEGLRVVLDCLFDELCESFLVSLVGGHRVRQTGEVVRLQVRQVRGKVKVSSHSSKGRVVLTVPRM